MEISPHYKFRNDCELEFDLKLNRINSLESVNSLSEISMKHNFCQGLFRPMNVISTVRVYRLPNF